VKLKIKEMKKINVLIMFLTLTSAMAYAQSSIVGKTNKIGSIEIAQFDFPEKMNLKQAENACKTLGNGWRLATITESKILFQNKNRISNIKNDIYWCAKDEYGDPWRFSFVNGIKMLSLGNVNSKYYVRAVKTN
jgi:hypothetical protein